MVASVDKKLEKQSVFHSPDKRFRLLRSAVFFGANASGKSNVIKAAETMRECVLESAKENSEISLSIVPFLLDKKTNKKPSSFEVHFYHEGVRYKYGFIISNKKIFEEWLFAFPYGKRQLWFTRKTENKKETKWKFGRNFKGATGTTTSTMSKLTRSDSLFLSMAKRLEHKQLRRIYDWFNYFFRITDLSRIPFHGLGSYTTKNAYESADFRKALLALLKAADTGIKGIRVSRKLINSEDLPFKLSEDDKRKEVKYARYIVNTLHQCEDEQVPFSLLNDESLGTLRLFELAGPIMDVLEFGFTFFADEMHASLHPLLLRALVSLLQNPKLNKKGAQLIFTSHDVTLFHPELFRRDQIWFTERDECGVSKLYSLWDYKPRKHESIQTRYLKGRYGGIPYIEDLARLWLDAKKKSK